MQTSYVRKRFLLALNGLRDLLSQQRQYSGLSASTSSSVTTEAVFGKHKLEFEVGKLARLADGACVVKFGKTQVLATAVCAPTVDTSTDFLPFQVDYRERLAAAGRIPATHSRRESPNSDREVLVARAVDRALRPLFPPGFCYETQLHAVLLSGEDEQQADVVTLNAASAALVCSDIPWGGPVGAVRLGFANGAFMVNPSSADLAQSDLNLLYAGTATRGMMVECGAQQVTEKVIAEALRLGQKRVAELIPAQLQLAATLRRRKRVVTLLGLNPSMQERIEAQARPLLEAAFAQHELGKAQRAEALNHVKGAVLRQLSAEGLLADKPGPGVTTEVEVAYALDVLQSQTLRRCVLEGGLRPDGRRAGELRQLHIETAPLPLVHGSALFERGETQSLCTATVGTERDALPQDGLGGRSDKPLMLHYSFPAFSVNELGKVGGPNRREIGHGALAEKALQPLMPEPDKFPFAVRVNADTLQSSGSSSMAAVCGGALALQTAGVPIRAPAAGISIGLLTERPPTATNGQAGGTPCEEPYGWPQDYGKHELLVDIQGLEDHLGDMDYKIAGTARGITAMQLDIKLPGVPVQLLVEALQPARRARQALLAAMDTALQQDRRDVQLQPRYGSVEINKELLPRLIGPYGSRLQQIETTTGGRLILNETGEIQIYAPTMEQYNQAVTAVREVEGASIKDGVKYTVRVARIVDYGAFVELPNGIQALLHISELSHSKLRDVRDILKENMVLDVLCIGRDAKGMIKLSRKALLTSGGGGGSSSSSSRSDSAGKSQRQQQLQTGATSPGEHMPADITDAAEVR